MPTIPSGDLALLRAEGHTSSVYASFLKPATLWWAQVNSGSLSRGDRDIPWDGGGSGGGGDYTAVNPFQTVWVGTTPGGNEIGEVRIRTATSGDGGVTGTLNVAPNVIPWVDDLYLTFKHNYEFWPMYPYIDPDTEVFYKDGDLGYDNNNLTPNPVVIAEFSQRAGFIRNGELTFWVDASDSYATASGATISSYALTVYPTTGVTVTFNTSTGIGRIDVTSLTQEYYWCRFVVTDSNGRNQVSFRCIFAHDPDPTGSTFPHKDFTVNQLTGAWERGGWYAQVNTHDNASLNDIPDGTFAVLWAENAWGLGENIAEVRRDDIKLFVNPKFSYTVTPNGGNCDIDVTFTAGVLVNGQPAPDSTSMGLDLSVNGGTPVPVVNTTSGGIIILNNTFTNEPCTGSILAEDLGNTRTIATDSYRPGEQVSRTGEWPSIMKAFPQTLIVGYVRRENLTFSTAPQGGTGQDTLEITTVEDMLRNQFMFSISLAARPSPSTWYEYASWLTIGRACHHIWRWHSTLMRIADVKGLVDNTDGRAYAEFENGTLYSMPDTMARQHGIRAHIVCNKKGQLTLVQDAQLLIDADRAALDVIANVMPADRSGEIGILREHEDRVALVYSSGLVFSGTFTGADNDPEVEPYCAMAPGLLPSGWGEGTVNLERQVITSQGQLNELAGRKYAAENNEYPEIRIRTHGNYLEYLDFYPAEFWEIDLGVGDTIKELAIPDLNLILRSVTARVDVDQIGGTIRADLVFEPEMDGPTGVASDCPAGPTDLQGEITPVPVPAELPGAIVTASSVDYLPYGSSTWVQRTTEGTRDLIQDPFWRTRQSTNDPSSSILLRCGPGFVKRSTNAGVSWSAITPSSDPPNDAGDAPAPTATGVTYFRMDGSFITQSEFIVLARWQNASSEWRSWIAFTDDDGATWTWEYLGDAVVGCNNFGTQSADFSTGGWRIDEPYWHQGNPILEVAADKFVIIYEDISENTTYVRCFSLSGDTVTWGSAVSIGAGSGTLGDGGHLFYVDTNKFGVIYQTGDGIGQAYVPGIKIGTISGETISLGSVQYVMNTYENTTLDGIYEVGSGLSAVCPNTSTVVVTRFGKIMETSGDNCVESSDYGWWLMWGSISGTTITWEEWTDCGAVDLQTVGKWRDMSRSLIVNDAGASVSIQVGSVGLTVYEEGGAIPDLYAVGVSATENGKSSPVLIYSGIAAQTSWCLFPLTSTKAVIIWQTYTGPDDYDLYGAVITMTGTTPSVGASNLLWSDTGTYADIPFGSAITSARAVLGYTLSTGSCQSLMVIDIDGNDITVAALCDSAHTYVGAVYGQTTTKFMVMSRDPSSQDGAMFTGITAGDVATCGGTGDSRALGGKIGKGLGAVAWVTAHDGSVIELLEVDLSTVTVSNRTAVCSATETEVDNETFIAWPWPAFTDDDKLYVFGRLDNTVGLGLPTHIMYTANGGTTFSLLESGWASDTCGSFFSYGGFIVAARNAGARARVYLWNGATMDLKSTSPLNAGVKVEAMAVDYRDFALVLCSNAADTIMVVGAAYPYVEWGDLTSNHPNTAGVFAVEIL